MPLGWSIFNKDNLEHLISVLKEHYKINMDWEGTQCLKSTICQEQGSPATSKANEKKISWQVVGVLLGSGQLIQPSTLFSTPQLPPKPSQQRTQWNMELIKWHLKYAATNLDAILIFKKSNMVLSSASYLTSLPLEDAPAKTSSAPLILVNHPKTAPYIILNIS